MEQQRRMENVPRIKSGLDEATEKMENAGHRDGLDTVEEGHAR